MEARLIEVRIIGALLYREICEKHVGSNFEIAFNWFLGIRIRYILNQESYNYLRTKRIEAIGTYILKC